MSGTETGDRGWYQHEPAWHPDFPGRVVQASPVRVAETIAGTSRPVVGIITTGDLDALARVIFEALGAKYRAGIRLDRSLFTPEQWEQADAEQSAACAAMWQGLSELYAKATR